MPVILQNLAEALVTAQVSLPNSMMLHTQVWCMHPLVMSNNALVVKIGMSSLNFPAVLDLDDIDTSVNFHWRFPESLSVLQSKVIVLILTGWIHHKKEFGSNCCKL